MSLALSTEHLTTGFYYLAWFSTILFIIKMILFSLTGGDSEVFTDFNTETDTDISFNFFSIQSILAFFMGFGWMGYAGLNQFSFSQPVNFAIAFVVGILFLVFNTALMFAAKKLEKNVKKDKTKTINQTGKAYTNFEPHSKGQVEILVNEQLSIVNAVNDTDEHINSFEEIRVTDVKNDVLYIEKVNK